jgi:hypothetical protein
MVVGGGRAHRTVWRATLAGGQRVTQECPRRDKREDLPQNKPLLQDNTVRFERIGRQSHDGAHGPDCLTAS